MEITYTANMAHKDMNDCLNLRAAENKRKYEDGLNQITEININNIVKAIRHAATSGCSSAEYYISDMEHDNDMYYAAHVLLRPVLEALFNAGYKVEYTEETDEDNFNPYYSLYISW